MVHPITILIVDLNLSKRKKRIRDGWTDRQMDGRTDGRTNRKIRNIFLKVAKSRFYEGGTNIVFMKVAQMSFFNYRWDKFRVLAIGGTYVYLIEGGTNVGGTNVGGKNVGGRKVAASVRGPPQSIL
jgi:hypothetical protein